MAKWIGQSVSVECHDLGVFQGVVAAVDSNTSTVTLKHTFKNGKPCDPSNVSLLASQIKNLQFVEPLSQLSRPAPVESSDDDRDANKSKAGARKKPAKVIRVKTATHDGEGSLPAGRRRSNSFTSADCTLATPLNSDTPKKVDRYNNRFNDNDCFGVSVESCMGDFDFEKNLALFDKQRVFGEIEHGLGSRRTPSKPDKYKHDEMIIKPNKAVRQIKLKDSSQVTNTYTTDNGLLIPCISYQTREELFSAACRNGFTDQRRVDIVGRNTSDMVFHLIGGSTRMNPQNTHQKATVVILAGPHIQGCYGVACARHLANHNINTIVFSPSHEASTDLKKHELAFYKMSGAKTISEPDDLPTSTVDLIINCLESEVYSEIASKPWYKYITNWCNTSRAHVLAIDPSTRGTSIETKWSVHIGLPLALPQSLGQTYLCDAAIPRDLFLHIGVKYRSPFGIKFCIPLYNE